MALFSKTKKTEKAEKKEAKTVAPAMPAVASAKDVLRAPRITEKASVLAQQNVIVFNVSADATKNDIVSAIKKQYKVTPQSVRIVPVPSKTVRHMKTGRTGVKSGGKKAYVYLKKGDTLNIA